MISQGELVPNKPKEKFGARLRQTREMHGLNQTELAKRAGLTAAAVSQLESGDRMPAFETQVKLAKALGTSVSYLLGEESPDLPPKLKAVFRDLNALSANDLEKVRDFAAYLRAKTESNTDDG